jgi:hypothetical protein
MKLITLSIDRRASHVVNFERSSDAARPVDTYVITKSDDTELLTFYHGAGSSIFSRPAGSFAGDRDDEDFLPSPYNPHPQQADNGLVPIVLQTSQGQSVAYIQSIGCTEEADAHLTLSIALTTERVPMLPVPPRVSFRPSGKGDQWGLTLRELPDAPAMIRVLLTFSEPGNMSAAVGAERELLLCVAPPADIADVVLDFGSEATQMAVFDQSPMDIDGIQPIFEDMKELLVGAGTGDGATGSADGQRYVQQDVRDGNLFRSVFYAKTQMDAEATPVPSLNSSPDSLTISADPMLKMMTTENEAQALQQDGAYIQMPNVKISGFGGVREPRVGGKAISKVHDAFFYRSTINRFILGAFTKVDSNGQAKCVRLNVLMPNVYTHNDVQSRLRWLKEDIAAMLASNEALACRVRCCEVIVLSESDASLLGALDLLTHPYNPHPLAPGLYLIMDAGKGTLDFSIVEYRGGEVQSRFRSGIIGAGNAMSYAYVLGLLHDFFAESTVAQQVKDENLQEWVFSKILQGDVSGAPVDTARLRRLMEAVDRYKIAVSDGQSDYTIRAVPADVTAIRAGMSFSQLDFDTFITYVTKMTEGVRYKPLSKNAQRYVEAMATRIAADAARSLSIAKAPEFSNILGVFFAGRAFRDHLLKATIFSRLKADGIVQQELEYLDEDHYAYNQKNICLYVRSHLQRGVTSNRMLSTPFARVRRQLQATVSQTDGGGLFATIGRGWSRITKRAPKVLHPLSEAVTGYDTDDDAFAYDYVAALAPLNGMVYGYDLYINDMQLDWILIGGTYYHPTDSGHLKLFYSDDRIFVRSEGPSPTTKELLPDAVANMRFSSLTFATLFPYVNARSGEANRVFIPKADKAAAPSVTAGQPVTKPSGILLGDPNRQS